MAFDTFDTRLQSIANDALVLCKARFGARGLRTEKAISPKVGWTPSFYLRHAQFNIIAVEVADNLFPEALKGAAHDIELYTESLVSVYQACSLQAYQNDPKQTKVRLLLEHGFGIITVDDDGTTRLQHSCVPLTQHISEEKMATEMSGLTPALKVAFTQAHVTYSADVGQGLQKAGQIVEALVHSISASAAKKNVITPAQCNGKPADEIDALYPTPTFRDHRAALGGARNFIKEFRNTASHPQKTAKQAAQKVMKCKAGFLQGIEITKKLRHVAQALHYQIQVHVI